MDGDVNAMDAGRREAVHTALHALKGDRTKNRLFSCWVDNAGAIAVAFALANQFTFLNGLIQGLSAYLLYLFYFFISEVFFSTTPGKWCFGLTVLSVDGEKCTVSQAAIRAILRIVEVNPLILGVLPAMLLVFFSERSQRLGGRFSNTVVVKVR